MSLHAEVDQLSAHFWKQLKYYNEIIRILSCESYQRKVGQMRPFTVQMRPFTGQMCPFTIQMRPFTVQMHQFTVQMRPFTFQMRLQTGAQF